MQRKRLLVEGWRHISHSFALVNQHQLLAWRRRADLVLFHRDLPLYRSEWAGGAADAGFDAAARESLAAIAAPDGGDFDAVYRIAYPTPAAAVGPGAPQYTFIVTAFGLAPKELAAGCRLADLTAGGNAIVTPSAWSRDRLVESGVDASGVHVVPHGVRTRTFRPFSADERLARRRALGWDDDHFVFANVGIASWNKGLDCLIVAFAQLRKRHAHVRLVLKNHLPLYGAQLAPFFDAVAAAHPGLLDDAVMDSIFVVESNLDQEALRELYACADCYVSPYRAEGFNLPVLEAIACGTPVVVTGDGATADFCAGPWATRVAGRRLRPAQLRLPHALAVEIDGDALFHAMAQRLLAPQAERRLSGPPWERLLQEMSWEAVSDRLLELMLPGSAAAAASAPTSTLTSAASAAPTASASASASASAAVAAPAQAALA